MNWLVLSLILLEAIKNFNPLASDDSWAHKTFCKICSAFLHSINRQFYRSLLACNSDSSKFTLVMMNWKFPRYQTWKQFASSFECMKMLLPLTLSNPFFVNYKITSSMHTSIVSAAVFSCVRHEAIVWTYLVVDNLSETQQTPENIPLLTYKNSTSLIEPLASNY